MKVWSENTKKTLKKVLAYIGGGFLVLILAVNLILAVQGFLHPGKPAGIFGIMPVMMTTDSMAPAIRNGDLMLFEACDPAAVVPGDVILYKDPKETQGGGFVTHRVLETAADSFITGSDADGERDALPVPQENLFGRYRGTVPLLGSLIGFLKTVPGIVTAAVLVVLGTAGYEIVTYRKEKAREGMKTGIDKSAVGSV